MSSSTLFEDGLDEKRLKVGKPDLARIESNVEKAIDAEANIDNAPASDDTQGPDDDDPGPPPDGGAMAWLQVLGSFFLFFNSWCARSPSVPAELCR